MMSILFLDGNNIDDVEVDDIVYIDEEVEGWTDFNAIVGFTAGTGGATNRHAIKNLIVSDTNCE